MNRNATFGASADAVTSGAGFSAAAHHPAHAGSAGDAVAAQHRRAADESVDWGLT